MLSETLLSKCFYFNVSLIYSYSATQPFIKKEINFESPPRSNPHHAKVKSILKHQANPCFLLTHTIQALSHTNCGPTYY